MSKYVSMANIKQKNEEVRRRTWNNRITDLGKRISSLKWQWAGHTARRTDGRIATKKISNRDRRSATNYRTSINKMDLYLVMVAVSQWTQAASN